MRKAHIFLITVIIVVISSCHKQYLQGYYSRDAFIEKCEWKTKVHEKYEMKANYMDSIKMIKYPVDVRIYLGTYCPDSKKWIPRFFAIQDQLPIAQLEIISVDSSKVDIRGMTVLDSIEKIPTFIFLREGKEIGRIVEKPKKRLEKRIFEELK